VEVNERWQLRKNVQRDASSTCSIGMLNPGRSYSRISLNPLVNRHLHCSHFVFYLSCFSFSGAVVLTVCFLHLSDAEVCNQGKESVGNLVIPQYLLVGFFVATLSLSLSHTHTHTQKKVK